MFGFEGDLETEQPVANFVARPLERTFRAGSGGEKKCRPEMDVVAFFFVRECLVKTTLADWRSRRDRGQEVGSLLAFTIQD